MQTFKTYLTEAAGSKMWFWNGEKFKASGSDPFDEPVSVKSLAQADGELKAAERKAKGMVVAITRNFAKKNEWIIVAFKQQHVISDF